MPLLYKVKHAALWPKIASKTYGASHLQRPSKLLCKRHALRRRRQIVEDSADRFTWVGDHRLQAGYWRTAGVDPKFMMLAYQTWFEAFVKAIDPEFELITTEENGTRLYTIAKK